MDNKYWLKVLIFLATLAGSLQAQQQDRKSELENDKKRIEEEIAFTSKLISETRESRTLTLSELKVLSARINRQEALVATLRRQIRQLDDQIRKSENELKQLNSELQSLRDEYARMIYFAYKNRKSYSKLVFLFSASDFNQAYQRLKYFQQYAAFRQGQITRIEETQNKIDAQREKLVSERTEKQTYFDAERKAQISLNTERSKMDQAVKQLSQKENQLRQALREKEREAQKLQRAIEKIISEEIRLARERKGEKDPVRDRLMELTPEERIISDNFAQNRGKLPWPTERGVIASRFGEQPHPVLKKVTIKNNGIDLATTPGSDARAVFDGIVVSVTPISNTNQAVIIRHGEFFTVYSNLEDVYVKRGDLLKTKEVIGRIHTDKKEAKTEVHFELWKGRQIQDPAGWLAR
jgi:septal ring factor EnvC (AmiA/AmiB activator)